MASASSGPIGKLVNVVISTARFDRMIDFYASKLGLEPFFKDATSCFFKAGGANLVLVRSVTEPPEPAEKVCLDFGVSSVAGTAERLRHAGIEIEAQTADLIQIRDLDGNLIEFVNG